MITVYGLKNCDTCRKALKWLAAENIAHDFIDIRAETPDTKTIRGWIKAAGLETLVNKSSTTWRSLDQSQKDGLAEASATDLLGEHPTLIKRPVFVSGENVIVGFKDAQKQALAALPR